MADYAVLASGGELAGESEKSSARGKTKDEDDKVNKSEDADVNLVGQIE